MNEHIEALMQEYYENLESFNKMKEIVLAKLKELLIEKNKMFLEGVEARVKEDKSLRKKLELKGMKYKTLHDITDILGARIITFYNDEVDIVASTIEKNFTIDYDNSIDKRKMYDIDRFGYMSLHYICTIPKTMYYDEKNPAINEYKFEIQIRTALQHVWATINHDTGYKSDIEVPKEYMREFSRLAGMLELADDEFRRIRDDVNSYRDRIKTLVSKGDFKDITLNIDSFKSYLEIKPYDSLIKRIAKINNSEIENLSLEPYYEILIDLGFKTLSEVEKMRVELSEEAYKLALIQLKDTDLDILASTVALQNLCIVYIVKNGGGEEELMKAYKKLFGEKLINEKLEKKMISKILEQTKGIATL